MFALSAVGATPLKPQVTGDPPVAVQDLHAMRAQSQIDARSSQRRGHAVKAAVHPDVVVDVDLAALEDRAPMGMQWQRPQQRLVEPLEPLPATTIELLERALVQVLQQLGQSPD